MTQDKNNTKVEVPFYDEVKNTVETEVISYKLSDISDKTKKRLISQYIYVYLTNQRQGTRQTKTRGEVTASTKKIYRQKGTGRARHGDKKAPIFVGGGVAHGPRMHKFSKNMNSKQKKLALRYSIEYLLKENKLMLLSAKEVTKTKKASEIMKLFGVEKALLVPSGKSQNMRGFRNLSGVEITHVSEVNPYFLLSKPKVICEVESWKKLSQYVS